MELPTIKLNIFKKLEYFLVLKTLNRQFDAQLEIVRKRNTVNKVLPTWEIEKKILFWTYAYHKHLGSPLTKKDFSNGEENKLADIFISEYEIGGKEKQCNEKKVKRPDYNHVFKNLVQMDFANEVEINKKNKDSEEKGEKTEKAYVISQKGLAFGELLWFLYKPKKYPYWPRKLKDYCDSFDTKFTLSRWSWSYIFMSLQLWAFYVFVVYAALLIVAEVIEGLNLSRQAHKYFSRVGWYADETSWLWMLFGIPFVFFLVGFVGAGVVGLFTTRKYKKIEKIRPRKDE